jgi:hypothetical protein
VANGISGISHPEITAVKWSVVYSHFTISSFVYVQTVVVPWLLLGRNFVVASRFGWSMYQASASGQTTNRSRYVKSPAFFGFFRDAVLFQQTTAQAMVVRLRYVSADGNAGFHWENCGDDEEQKTLCLTRRSYYPLSGKYNHILFVECEV